MDVIKTAEKLRDHIMEKLEPAHTTQEKAHEVLGELIMMLEGEWDAQTEEQADAVIDE